MSITTFPATATGNVTGPASSTTGHIATFADGTGKVLADGGAASGGTVTNVSSADANATVATPTTTPVITIVSAPKLATARAIGGVNFDGSASINPGVPLTSKSAAYTFALADANTTIYHPASDANTRAWIIPANGSIPFPVGTAITLINDSANNVTVTVTTDVLSYANVGAITTLTIPQYNQATIYKVLSAQWNCNGSTGCTTA